MNNIEQLVETFMADYTAAVDADGNQVANAWADKRVQELSKDLNEEDQLHFVKLVAPKLQAVMQAAINELDEAEAKEEEVVTEE